MFQKEVKEVFSELQVKDKGLTSHQAEVRLHKYGLNELQAKEGLHPIKIFLQQFTSPLVWILILALVVSIILHETVDAYVIGAIIILNAILGFIQEYKAEKAIEALKKMASPRATVLRNGKQVKIESKYVVPGDILILETGDKIPADCRVIEVHELKTQEGPLTGESQPVSKHIEALPDKTPLADRKNMVYSATVITNGRGRAVVTSTGMSTQVGKIATLIQTSHPKQTPLQKKLRKLGTSLTYAVIVVAVVVFLAGWLGGTAATTMFLTAIALAVAAIPEGLPAVITISLALGVQRMIKRNALVRKLPSVETLGSVDVICTDKTGTLTHNEMTVTRIYANEQVYQVTGSGYKTEGKFMVEGKMANPEHLHQLLTCGAVCNDAALGKEVFGDPTEAALLVSAGKAGFTQKELKKKYARTEEIPFSSERKMMTTMHDKIAFTKGSPEIVLNKCTKILINGKVRRLERADKKAIIAKNKDFASQALRVLGLAYNDKFSDKKGVENNLVFLGLQAMIDPPRKEVAEAIEKCRGAGIRVIMITGDQINTAKAIGKELGITGKAVEGKDLAKINLHKEIKNINIFARVNPEHKLKIVEALKKAGHVVAMTGDGVNDAPALKKADIGISMGITGTDVAKEASDMILTDDNFTSIVSAVEEGRGIFDNIRKFVNYLLSSNLGEIAVILFASILGMGLPLTAIQILWVNLVTDGLPATALSLDPHSEGIMNRKPRGTKENILSKPLQWDILVFGVLMGIFGVILFALYQGVSLMKAQTMVFTSLVLFELVRLHTIRREYKLSLMSNKPLLWAIVISLVLHLGTIYGPAAAWFKTAPLQLIDWGILIVASLVLYVTYFVVDKFIIQKLVGNK